MSKSYVYNRIPIYGVPRRNKSGKVYPENSRLILVDFDGEACLVKPAGKGNKAPIYVRACFIECNVPLLGRVTMTDINLVQYIRAMEVKTK